MKKTVLLFGLIVLSITVSFGGYIYGSAQVCPGETASYGVNFQTQGTCWAVGWIVKDANGNNVPWTNAGSTYNITVVWPPGNGIGSVKATGIACCSIKWFCGDKVESLNVKIGPDNVTGISGPITMCNSSISTFSISPLSNATSYTWVVPSGWLVNGQSAALTTTSTSVSIQSSNTGTGSYPISVNANACNGTISSTPYTKYVNVGSFTSFNINGPSCLSSSISNYTLSFSPFISGSYEWIVRLGSNAPITYTTSSVSLYIYSPTRIDAQLRINTGCGWSDWKSFFAYPCTGGSGGFQLLEVYPNSASNEVTVEVPKDLDLNLVSLRNGKGDLVNTIRIDENIKSFQIDVSKYDEGTYFLNFQTRNGIITKRLLIKR
jgi:hypothetical protein